MDTNDPLKELDFVPHVACETITVTKRWPLLPARRQPCKARAEYLVRVHHMPVTGQTDEGDAVHGCCGAQTAVCLEHAHDFYHDTLEALADFLGWVGRCPGCNAEVEDEDDVYVLDVPTS